MKYVHTTRSIGDPMNTEYAKGFLLTALGVIVLSFDALLIRMVNTDEFSLLFWRGLLMSLMVSLWTLYRKPELKLVQLDLPYIRSAILFALSSIFFVSAIHHTSVANVLVIISAQPLLAAVIAQLTIGEKSPPITWIAIFICMLGIGWVMQDSWSTPNLTGDLLALACALSLSSKFVNDRAVKDRDMTPALVFAGGIIAITGLFWGAPLSLQGNQWGWMLLLCLIVIPIAFILITLGPTRIPAAEVGMLMLLETIAGPLLVWLFISEAPSANTLMGGSIVILTLLTHSLLKLRSKHATAR